jgi:hypothetical protein
VAAARPEGGGQLLYQAGVRTNPGRVPQPRSGSAIPQGSATPVGFGNYLGNMGGTGNAGFVDWNISVLPGDMGDSGNASTCHGSGATTWILITSDEATAATMGPSGEFDHCLLREGQDYYVNFMSHGHPYAIDCSTDDCTIGTFAFSNPTTSDGSPFLDQVPCP